MQKCALCSIDKNTLIYENPKWYVLLIDDPDFPGYIRIVWREHIAEMTDLSADDRALLMQVVWLVEQTVRDIMKPDKINLASLGNMVPHLHWHVIARYRTDKCFPDAIWANAKRENDQEQIAQLKIRAKELAQALVQCLDVRFQSGK